MSVIDVTYRVFSTRWHIDKALKELEKHAVVGFDTETRGVYSKEERKAAKEFLKGENLPVHEKSIAQQVAANSGLSFPSLINVTHFIFGISDSESIILVCNSSKLELYIWNWIASYNGLMLIHNTLYDLKIMYHRIRKYPKNYEDTQLLAKCLINDADRWRAKVGLKDLMGSHYPPAWALVNEYEPDDLKEPKFLLYGATDGAATFKLWYDIQDHLEERK